MNTAHKKVYKIVFLVSTILMAPLKINETYGNGPEILRPKFFGANFSIEKEKH